MKSLLYLFRNKLILILILILNFCIKVTGRMSSRTCYTKLNFDFPYVRSPLSLHRDSNAKRKTNTRQTGEVIYSYIDS